MKTAPSEKELAERKRFGEVVKIMRRARDMESLELAKVMARKTGNLAWGKKQYLDRLEAGERSVPEPLALWAISEALDFDIVQLLAITPEELRNERDALLASIGKRKPNVAEAMDAAAELATGRRQNRRRSDRQSTTRRYGKSAPDLGKRCA